MPSISIHALRVEGDSGFTLRLRDFVLFLSTPSGWRATAGLEIPVRLADISIHALRVEGDWPLCRRFLRCVISIHALRVEGDVCDEVDLERGVISIHALRVEGDQSINCSGHHLAGISIHALRVEGDSKNGQSFHLFLRKREKNLPL